MATKRKDLDDFIQELTRKHKSPSDQHCYFSAKEITALNKMFLDQSRRCGQKGKITRDGFRDFLGIYFRISDDTMLDRIFRAFDTGAKTYLSPEDFVFGMSTFLRGTLSDRINYCFKVYDMNDDGFISRDELFQLLKNCLVKQSTDEDQDEGVKDLIELVLKKMDFDHDGKISAEEWKSAILKDDLLLECLGPCLPADHWKTAMLKMISQDPSMNSFL